MEPQDPSATAAERARDRAIASHQRTARSHGRTAEAHGRAALRGIGNAADRYPRADEAKLDRQRAAPARVSREDPARQP